MSTTPNYLPTTTMREGVYEPQLCISLLDTIYEDRVRGEMKS